jgi:hypothetical protein
MHRVRTEKRLITSSGSPVSIIQYLCIYLDNKLNEVSTGISTTDLSTQLTSVHKGKF